MRPSFCDENASPKTENTYLPLSAYLSYDLKTFSMYVLFAITV